MCLVIYQAINLIFIKKTGPNLIEKIFLLTGRISTDNSTNIYLDKINMLLDTYAPVKKINKYKLKFKSKPWITLGLQNQYLLKTNYLQISLIRRTLY